MMKKLGCLAVLLASIPAMSYAFVAVNNFRPYDAAVRLPQARKDDRLRIGVQAELGDRKQGRDWKDDRRNVLQLHNVSESTVTMVERVVNTKDNAAVNALAANLAVARVEDDGTRGHVQFSGEYQGYDLNVNAGFQMPFKPVPGTLTLGVHIPVVYRKIDNVKHKDLTKNIRPEDIAAQNLLTDDIVDHLKNLGGLKVENWSKTGIGDVVAMVNWHSDYRQDKDYLKNVRLHAKLGLNIPSGKEKDEDQAFSMPLGNDGAWGLPLGMGMQLDFVNYIRAGIDVDFLVLFDKSRHRRMKTHEDQTDFFLLNKGRASKEYGLTWQFHLYAQGFHIMDTGLNASVGYQFVKHDDDRINPRGNDFSFGIVNSATSLKEWNAHNVVFRLGYDLADDSSSWFISPQVSAFYKLPIAGKNVIDNHSFGGQLALNF